MAVDGEVSKAPTSLTTGFYIFFPVQLPNEESSCLNSSIVCKPNSKPKLSASIARTRASVSALVEEIALPNGLGLPSQLINVPYFSVTGATGNETFA